MTAPILKWLGGKSKLLPQLLPLLPDGGVEKLRHVELFAGGAAMFFHLQPEKALLADACADLIRTYTSVRDALPEVSDHLLDLREEHARDDNFYYSVREHYNRRPSSMTEAEIAACFIYLNKTCFNGVYRVNREGRFNVPKGSYVSPKIFDPDLLGAASSALDGAELACSDFEVLSRDLGRGDFVYLDPPYEPSSETANFTSYTASKFDWEDQLRLRQTFQNLSERGCKVMLSNSYVPSLRVLYSEFKVSVVESARSVNSDASKRGRVWEIVVTNY